MFLAKGKETEPTPGLDNLDALRIGFICSPTALK